MLNAPRGCLSFTIKFLGRTVYIAHWSSPYALSLLKSLPSGICPPHPAAGCLLVLVATSRERVSVSIFVLIMRFDARPLALGNAF